MKNIKFSKPQLFTLILASCVNFFSSICISLQAPFYPAEAEGKGATATEYGLVLGSYELVVCLFSPVCGKIIHKTGYKMLLGVGMITCSIAVAIFGLLDWVNDRFNFIFLSFVLRIIEALGASAAVIAGFSIMSCMFQDNMATVMATLEMFYGFGFIIGPTVGGLLYQVGGFPTPFIFVGAVSAIVSTLIFLFVPDVTQSANEQDNNGKFKKVLKDSSVLIDTASVMVFAMSQGFFLATLEPHLRIFHISSVLVSFIFIINGLTYAISSPFFGKLVDTWINPTHILMLACVFNIASSSMIAPLPFLPIPNNLVTSILGLFFLGLASAAGNVSSFIDSIRNAINAGFLPNMSTYGLMSGIWCSAYSLGAFIGPSISGILYDLVGFQLASIFVITVNLILLIISLSHCIFKKLNKKQRLTFTIGDPAENNTLDNIFEISNDDTSALLSVEDSSNGLESYYNNYGTL